MYAVFSLFDRLVVLVLSCQATNVNTITKSAGQEGSVDT